MKYFYLTICIIFFLGIAHHASAGTIVRPVHHFGLVGYWSMDEGAGNKVFDRSGNLNHGDMINMDSGTDWVDGQIGGALNFDGVDDYVEATSDSSLDITGDISIFAWIKRSSMGGGTKKVVAKSNAGGTDYEFGFDSNELTFYGDSVNGGSPVGSSGTVADYDFHQVGFVRDGTNYTFYIDAMDAGNGGSFTGSFSTGKPQQIGWARNLGGYYDGLIDEVRIYDRALSADEVRRLYYMGR